MEILHTTGIHKQVGDPTKVRKKVPPFATKKGGIGGLTFFSIFFQSWKIQCPKRVGSFGSSTDFLVKRKSVGSDMFR
jgi:hypothetical protein